MVRRPAAIGLATDQPAATPPPTSRGPARASIPRIGSRQRLGGGNDKLPAALSYPIRIAWIAIAIYYALQAYNAKSFRKYFEIPVITKFMHGQKWL